MKKLSLIPLALIATLGAAWAATIIFPNTTEFARVPQGAGTIGGALYGLFNTVDGSAKNTQKLAGKYASGYLQDRDCSGEPINKVWAGVDSTGRGICGRITTPLASIGKFTSVAGGVLVKKGGTGPGTPANLTDDLKPGDIIVTGGGTGTITFTDDLSILRLDTNTTVALSTGENTSGQSVAQAILSDGRLWGRILTSTGVNLGGGGMVAGVRGTSVSVEEDAGTVYIAIPHSTQGGGAAQITCPGSLIDDMGPEEIIVSGGSCQSHREWTGGDGTVGFYSNSEWVRSNTILDINYLREHSTDIIAQNELMVTLPQSDERTPLCINYDGNDTSGTWFPGLGCRPEGILAIADYTLAGSTGIMITPTSEYTKSMFNSCQNGPTDPDMTNCTLPLELRCNSTEDAVVGHYGRCQWPRIATGTDLGAIPTVGSPNGWKYDCDARDSVTTALTTRISLGLGVDGAENIYGGAKLNITCAKPAITNIGTPSISPGGLYIGTYQYISYPIDSVNKAINSTLAGKIITIELDNLTGITPTNVLVDFGSTLNVIQKSSTGYSCKWLGGTDCVTVVGNVLSFRAPTSGIVTFVVGNNSIVRSPAMTAQYIKPIGKTIKKITIQQ